MSVTPRVLLSIDYEPVFALFRHYDTLTDLNRRRELDSGFTLRAIDPILEQMQDSKASFYLVGEIVDWYPEIPQKIVAAGHELGLHCHIHRPLVNVNELADDVRASASWCRQYNVRGYRAPMIGIREAAYHLLGKAGFSYSSSIYAPAGLLLQKGSVWEIPVSTLRLRQSNGKYVAPRDFSPKLLLDGEIPYGSSFSIGLIGLGILKILEQELKRGRSPVIILHPYELVKPGSSLRLTRDLIRNPLFLPFLRNKSVFLADLLRNFPVSPLGTYLDEALKAMDSE
ncbi:MAG TPA: polysaccharide deacetylase family protein [Anaerolineales bacterium]|nr:polysaccharide deacetylase family protein [Anaerolineales bacterium]